MKTKLNPIRQALLWLGSRDVAPDTQSAPLDWADLPIYHPATDSREPPVRATATRH